MVRSVLLFDIDGTLIRAGGAGRAALNHAVRRLHGKAGVCDELSLAGRTDLWNFATAWRLVGAFESILGVILLGWSTSFFFRMLGRIDAH